MDRGSLATHRYRMKSAVAHFVDGRLFSPDFNDYYAARDPVAETVHVHIHPANLAVRMRQARTFSIFEFGFGAGINFLSISEEFLKNQSSDARLRFISCEAFPLELDTIRQAQKNASVESGLAQALLDFYPPLVSGIYRYLFAQDRVELTLIFTDIETALEEFGNHDTLGVDAWILDGFTPDRNPQMWDAKLISNLARNTRENGTVTTFSSASNVRRSLEENGFRVQKVEGTPFKRHTLCATLNKPCHQSKQPPRKITIVGGGFAGTSTARALARRGVQVQLMTPSGTVGDATSRIPTAVLHPRLSASMDVPAYFRTQTYFFAVPWMRHYIQQVPEGAVQISGKNMTTSRLNNISDMLDENWAKWLDSHEYSELTGLEFHQEAVFFPKSIVVNGEKVCQSLVDYPNIDLVKNRLQKPDAIDTVIYATGTASILGDLAAKWEVLTIEGQLDVFSHNDKSVYPRSVLIEDGYIVPTRSTCVVGSTYEYTRWKPGYATSSNLTKLQRVTSVDNWIHKGLFRGNRTVTSDKLPIVGQVGPNAWVNLAHGSSGTASTAYCAEILASQISGELAPLWRDCFDTITPHRFIERQVRRPNPLKQHRG